MKHNHLLYVLTILCLLTGLFFWCGAGIAALAETNDPVRYLDQSVAKFMARKIIRQYRMRFSESMIDEDRLANAIFADSARQRSELTNMWLLYPDARYNTILAYYNNVWEALRFLEENRPPDLASWFSKDEILADALIPDAEADATLTNKFPAAYARARQQAVRRQIAQLWPAADELERETPETVQSNIWRRFARATPLIEVEQTWEAQPLTNVYLEAWSQRSNQWRIISDARWSSAAPLEQIEESIRSAIEQYRQRVQADPAVPKAYELFPSSAARLRQRAHELFFAYFLGPAVSNVTLTVSTNELLGTMRRELAMHVNRAASWERILSTHYTDLVTRVVLQMGVNMSSQQQAQAIGTFHAVRTEPELYAAVARLLQRTGFGRAFRAARAVLADEQLAAFTPLLSNTWRFSDMQLAAAAKSPRIPADFLALDGIAIQPFDAATLLSEACITLSNAVYAALREGLTALDAQDRLVSRTDVAMRRAIRLYPYSAEPAKFFEQYLARVEAAWTTARVDALWLQLSYEDEDGQVQHVYNLPPNYASKYAGLMPVTIAAVSNQAEALVAFYHDALTNSPVIAVTIAGNRYRVVVRVRYRENEKELRLRNPDARNRAELARLEQEMSALLEDWLAQRDELSATNQKQMVLSIESFDVPYGMIGELKRVVERVQEQIGGGRLTVNVYDELAGEGGR